MCFAYCFKLSQVVLPKGIVEIGTAAFAEYQELTKIDIPDGVVQIGENAFADCTSLESITLPSTLISCGKGAFKYSTNISMVKSFSKTAPILSSDSFSTIASDAVLYVPTGCSATYSEWTPIFGGGIIEM